MAMDIVFRKSELEDIDQLVLLSGDEVGDLRYGYELKKEGTV